MSEVPHVGLSILRVVVQGCVLELGVKVWGVWFVVWCAVSMCPPPAVLVGGRVQGEKALRNGLVESHPSFRGGSNHVRLNRLLYKLI